MKQRNASVTKDHNKTNTPELKQEVILNPELVGNLLQRELARLNLNVLRTMARMLDEQERKFTAERNTLRASGRMMRAEMRRALSETVKINSERQKLDLERDVLQSQLLARRRSARLLDLMIQDFENGRKRTAPDINSLYMYSRVLGSAPAGNDLGQRLEYETNLLDQRRLYLQSLMQPRWQQLPEGDDVSVGELFPVDRTRMHPLRIPSSETEKGRANMGDAMLTWDWPRTGVSRGTVDGDLVSPVKSGPPRDDLVTSILLQDGLKSEREDERLDASQLYSVLADQRVESDEYPEQYDDTNIRRHSVDIVSSTKPAQTSPPQQAVV
jgi:hypothetical protein